MSTPHMITFFRDIKLFITDINIYDDTDDAAYVTLHSVSIILMLILIVSSQVPRLYRSNSSHHRIS